ncbi:ABC transporter ATP-binding protein [Shinella curvata]|uniref:ABC transporter ATP-binding protein n=1 Tax=Shinella curvata TaxID=1817964 RepID=A0ABT8XB49_9HYPH|nr:ABC transporter ATP-binding protein [Shinella curvata]MCJ8054645.1 ABC transporter ATP-binding protein [Shinella curvata]MDO6120960.1 ABC transporter ATP-binding protein [Shinella curvata]
MSDRKIVLEIRGLIVEAMLAKASVTEIVKGVSLELREGQVLGLVGESGAGKSTIGLASMGYFKPGCSPVAGEISFCGSSLLEISEAERRSIRGVRAAYVAQSAAASFNPSKRLMDQVVEAAVSRGELQRVDAELRAVELFRSLQLPDPESFGRKYPHQVSGGQLQRAMTAMALMCDPELIVFDEPTTALDVTTQVEVLLAIKAAIEERGVAALYISHDLAVVAQIADEVAVLRYGEIVERGPVTQMLESPVHPYTKSLWAVREMHGGSHPSRGRLLDVSGIEASYGAFKVLQDIEFTIERGQTVALVGESGSGKSTLGRVISGLLSPESGTVHLGEEALPRKANDRSRDMLRRVQLIYQSADTALNPRQKVSKIVGRPLSFFHGMRGAKKRSRMVDLMNMVELDPSYLDRFPTQLSGGQKQRVAIARALAAEPELIICDEITSALDQVVQAGILKMLDELQERLGVSYLFITHDLEVVKAISDRVVVMSGGRIVEQGPKSEVIHAPSEEYTRRLLNAVPQMSPGWLDGLVSRQVPNASVTSREPVRLSR